MVRSAPGYETLCLQYVGGIFSQGYEGKGTCQTRIFTTEKRNGTEKFPQRRDLLYQNRDDSIMMRF